MPDELKAWLAANGYASVSDAIRAAHKAFRGTITHRVRVPVPVPLPPVTDFLNSTSDETSYFVAAELWPVPAGRDGISGHEIVGTIPGSNVEVVLQFEPRRSA